MVILNQQLPDIDPEETKEWIESLQSVMRDRGISRARALVRSLLLRARSLNLGVPEHNSSRAGTSFPGRRSNRKENTSP
jgi:pyruvate dehydrogenase E1 component